MGPRACHKISLNQEQLLWAARSAKFFSVLGLARKVLGLKYHVLGMKMVVSDQSNWSQMNFLLHVDIEWYITLGRTRGLNVHVSYKLVVQMHRRGNQRCKYKSVLSANSDNSFRNLLNFWGGPGGRIKWARGPHAAPGPHVGQPCIKVSKFESKLISITCTWVFSVFSSLKLIWKNCQWLSAPPIFIWNRMLGL